MLNARCRYAECRYPDCRGALKLTTPPRKSKLACWTMARYILNGLTYFAASRVRRVKWFKELGRSLIKDTTVLKSFLAKVQVMNKFLGFTSR
jgi:hypothetical protein